MLAILLLALLAGSGVYLVLIIFASARFLSGPIPSLSGRPEPVSILKPLAGLDEGLEANLRTFFTQDYPEFEILFAVRTAEDPAVEIVERLRAEFAQVPSETDLHGRAAVSECQSL